MTVEIDPTWINFQFRARECQYIEYVFFAQLTNQDEVQKRIREILIWHDLEQIIAWRNYSAVRELVPNPKQMILQRFDALAASTEDASKPAPLLAYGLTDSRSRIVRDAALHYEALLFSGLGKQAKDLC